MLCQDSVQDFGEIAADHSAGRNKLIKERYHEEENDMERKAALLA